MAAADNSAIYTDLMRFKPEGLTPNAWAIAAGVSRTVWSDMRRHGNPSRRTLEKLLLAAGSSLAEFEALRISTGPAAGSFVGAGLAEHRPPAWRGRQLPPLPLMATAMADEWGDGRESIELTELRNQIVDRVARPPSLASDANAYAITIVGDSMWPRFRPGRQIAVSTKIAPAIGDDVVVKLKDGASDVRARVLIKELVRRSGRGVELRQFNPDISFHVPAAEIAAIEKVLGELV